VTGRTVQQLMVFDVLFLNKSSATFQLC